MALSQLSLENFVYRQYTVYESSPFSVSAASITWVLALNKSLQFCPYPDLQNPSVLTQAIGSPLAVVFMGSTSEWSSFPRAVSALLQRCSSAGSDT